MGTIDARATPPLDLLDGSWLFTASVQRWIDGDTVVVDCLVDVGFEEMVTKRRRIRLLGVDCPELHSSDPVERAAAHQAAQFSDALAPAGSVVKVQVVKYDKYGGRDDGSVVIDDTDVAQALLANGHARPYAGGPRGVVR